MKRSAGNVWHRFACAVLIVLGAQMAAAVDSYLLWQFDDDGEQITALNGDKIWVDELSLGDKKANVIRVRQVGGEEYLPLTLDGGATIRDAWPIDEEQLAAGPGYAIIGNVTPETQFMIEIGNLTGDEWVVLAASTVLSYGALDAAGYIWRSELGIPGGHWEPGYNVPEPSSALLLLLGGACVALRRRRGGIDGE